MKKNSINRDQAILILKNMLYVKKYPQTGMKILGLYT